MAKLSDLPNPQPMTTFNPSWPALARDPTNETVWEWPGATPVQWRQGASWHQIGGDIVVNWHGLLLEGWQPIDETTPHLPLAGRLPPMKPTTKPGAGTLRLCYAVGLATQVRIGRWAPIVDVVALLSAADQDAQRALLEAAIAADLVKLSGPFDDAHSIALTETGLDACTAAATAPERKKPAPAARPGRASSGRKRPARVTARSGAKRFR